MKITIKMLDESNLSYSWKTIYVGISTNILECTEISNYAIKLMSEDNYKDDEFINELSWGIEGILKDEVLIKMRMNLGLENITDDSEEWRAEKQKLRYILLNNLRNTIRNDGELLEKVEEVYAEFGYPQDMESFISYMPTNDDYDPSIHTLEENNNHLKELFFVFLEKEKENVKK